MKSEKKYRLAADIIPWKTKTMRSKRITRICSSCGRPFERADSMPLCRECLAELPGYMKMVENAKASLNFIPRRASDGPNLGAGP